MINKDNQIEFLRAQILEINKKLSLLLNKDNIECKYTFSEWLDEWMQLYKVGKLKESTLRNYEKYINENIKPYFKDKKLNEIDGLDIQKFLNSIKRNNTRVKVGNIIRASFEKAVKLRIIKYNPYSSVEIPAIKSKHYKPLEFDQQNEILKLITNPIYYPVFIFMCCTGLRIGEFLALNFSKDIDYTTNEIIINKSIDVYTNTIHNSTKTESGMRKVKFHSDLIPYIQELEKNQRSGKRYTYSMVRCYFKRLYAKLGYKGYNIHTFRHTFISVCYYVGMREKYIQKLVGHASLDMTLNTYTHILKRGNSPILEYIQKLKDIL